MDALKVVSVKMEAFRTDAFQKMDAFTRNTSNIETFNMDTLNMETITSTLRASVPWATALLVMLLISSIVKVVKYRRSYRTAVSLTNKPPSPQG
jgi:hypothetical protein